jgi:tetratricopeptide (TPR) repeat protein
MSNYLESASSDEEDNNNNVGTTSSSSEPAEPVDPAVVLARGAEFKALGNTAFAAGDYAASITHYTDAINNLKRNNLPADCVLHMNRSAAHISMKSYVKALHDANIAAELDPTQWKAHWRKGVGE